MSFFNFSFIALCSLVIFPKATLAADSNLSTFKAAGIKRINLSVPKGRISLSSSKTQKEITVNVIEPSKKQNEDNNKCIKAIGIEGADFNVKISSENILFEKASCDYDVVVTAPAGVHFDTSVSTGSAMIIIKDMSGNLDLKTGTGSVSVEGDILRNIDAKAATGSMDFNFKKCSGRADLSFLTATSKINLGLPSDCKVRVDHKSATGKLFNALGDSEDYLVLVTAKSASGDLTIKKN